MVEIKRDQEMMCYKDRTFCTDSECKKYTECPRAFSEEDKVQAVKWWGSDEYPLCQFAERLECFEGIKEIENEQS